MVLLIAGIAIVSVALQGGIWFSPKALKPQVKRLNPLSGIKRIFGPHALWELVKALLKTALLPLVVYVAVRQLIPTLYGAGLDVAGDAAGCGGRHRARRPALRGRGRHRRWPIGRLHRRAPPQQQVR